MMSQKHIPNPSICMKALWRLKSHTYAVALSEAIRNCAEDESRGNGKWSERHLGFDAGDQCCLAAMFSIKS